MRRPPLELPKSPTLTLIVALHLILAMQLTLDLNLALTLALALILALTLALSLTVKLGLTWRLHRGPSAKQHLDLFQHLGRVGSPRSQLRRGGSSHQRVVRKCRGCSWINTLSKSVSRGVRKLCAVDLCGEGRCSDSNRGTGSACDLSCAKTCISVLNLYRIKCGIKRGPAAHGRRHCRCSR